MDSKDVRKRKPQSTNSLESAKKLKKADTSLLVCCLTCRKVFSEQEPHYCFCKSGLLNLGNSCYINSVLQVLAELQIEPKLQETSALSELLSQLRSYNSKPLSVEGILEEIGAIWTHRNMQEDAHEFLICMMQLLNHSKFLFEVQSQGFCENCKNAFGGEVKEDNTFHMVMNGVHLQDQIKGVSESIEMNCSVCNYQKQIWNKQIVREPEILVVKLNRFYFNAKTGRACKITNKVELPQELKVNERLYRLNSVIMHKGKSLHYGHYVSYFYNKRIEIDDEKVNYGKVLDLDYSYYYIAFYS